MLQIHFAVGVAAVAYLMRGDVRTGAATFRRNLKHIRGWLEEESAAASKYVLKLNLHICNTSFDGRKFTVSMLQTE
jgi:hypothetical protein